MKIDPKKLALCLLLPLAAGAASAALSAGGMAEFSQIKKPPLTPPGWVFPVVWTALYLSMGAASYIVSRSRAPREHISCALTVYGCQLALNFFWPILFFVVKLYLTAFFWLTALWLAVLGTFAIFKKLSSAAGFLILPYLIWVTFAGYLNLGVYILSGGAA